MVDRCFCFDKSFADMKSVIDSKGITTLCELKKHITFGENCNICMPYVELVLKTGETDFDVINFDINNL
jgi:NAD(P)H-nitrite reductase large subunit